MNIPCRGCTKWFQPREHAPDVRGETLCRDCKRARKAASAKRTFQREMAARKAAEETADGEAHGSAFKVWDAMMRAEWSF